MTTSTFDGIVGDEFDEARRQLVAPTNWKNPTPKDRYHLVVIGAGTAGLVTAAGAAGLGAKVALIERGAMGGDCLNVGCVPSKAIIASAHRARMIRRADELGIHCDAVRVEFGAVMQRLRRLRAGISPHDSAERFQALGVDVFFGQGRFTSPNVVQVNGQIDLRFRAAVIATGARAAVPPIPGLSESGYVTNETLFRLTKLPRRFLVIGAGPIGCEMAQAFAALGSQVTLVDHSVQILTRELHEASIIVEQAMRRDGVEFVLGAKVIRVEPTATGKRVIVDQGSCERSLDADEILVAVGRAPNIQDLGLEAAGVESDARRGIQVDHRLRTANHSIYAAGDVCSKWQFTHAADFQARLVIKNALFMGRGSHKRLLIPRCTYTSPEIASVGMEQIEAEKLGIPTSVFELPFAQVDRAILEGSTEGFVRVICRAGTDRILGATLVGEGAGNLIAPIVIAMTRRIGLGKLGSVIHCYPTQAEAIRRLGDQYSRTRLTPFVKRLFDTWLRWIG